jgi:NAD(P)H-dependent FMN reductase
MIQVLVGTNRTGSRSEQFAQNICKKLKANGADAEVMNLSEIDWSEMNHHTYGSDAVPPSVKKMMLKINASDGLYIVCPEYNGSFPGALKMFIDYWDFPASFEKRPVCFTGMGGIFGGLRPVEHLQQVFGYRNSFIFPERVFLRNVWEVMTKEGEVADDLMTTLIDQQITNFTKFIEALKTSGLHCNTEVK